MSGGFRIRRDPSIVTLDKFQQIMKDFDVKKDSIYSFSSGVYTIPPNMKCITITMSGGGGRGGCGVIKNGIFYGGGGGGAGGSCLKKPVVISNPTNEPVILTTIIGKGGTLSYPDGGNTTVSISIGGKVVFKHVAHGGKTGGTAEKNSGGKGAGCSSNEMFGGYDGLPGSKTLAGLGVGKVFGGRGGNSAFEEGGLGGNQKNPFEEDFTDESFSAISNESNPGGLCGKMGSGGGGAVPGLDSTTAGDGGDGFVLVDF